jgi:PAS domain S-box-containing protein
LREVEKRSRLLVDSVRDYAIFMLDRDGIVTTSSRGAEQIKGYRAEEVIGRHFSRFYPPEERALGAKNVLRMVRAERHTEITDAEFFDAAHDAERTAPLASSCLGLP